jgi:hypothetical protein
MFDFTRFQSKLWPEWKAQFQINPNPGQYRFRPQEGGLSFYGTTDILIAEYILNNPSFTRLSETDKDQWAQTINRFQNSRTGWFQKTETLHYREHGTGYAVAALKLIDRHPIYQLKWKNKILNSPKTMERWIWHPNWSFIWATSHVISGVPAALAMVEEGNDKFFAWYFNWLDQHAHPESGFYHLGLIHKLGIRPHATMQELGGAFHMYYVYEYFRRQWPYSERIVDETLRLQHDNGLWDKKVTYCIDLDGIYSAIRSSRNANWYRKDEVKQAVEKYLATAARTLNDRDFLFRNYRDTHRLVGALAAIAECQKYFPELVHTIVPWRQSLDKACFI